MYYLILIKIIYILNKRKELSMSKALIQLKEINHDNFNEFELTEKQLEETKKISFVSKNHPNDFDKEAIKGILLQGGNMSNIIKTLKIDPRTVKHYYSDILYEYMNRGVLNVVNANYSKAISGDTFAAKVFLDRFDKMNQITDNSSKDAISIQSNKEELLALLKEDIKKEVKKETSDTVISKNDDELLSLLGSLSEEKKKDIIKLLKEK